jgi:hypothetical protein
MSNGILFISRRMQDSYCSQGRTPPPPIRKVEDGIQVVEKTLNKKVLCRHDVQDLNQVYRTMDLLERRMDKIPERSTHYVLMQIVAKVKAIIEEKETSAEGLISVYHLQNFSDQDLNISACFKSVFERFYRVQRVSGKNPNIEQSISIRAQTVAVHVPCCEPQEKFNEDVKALVKREDIQALVRIESARDALATTIAAHNTTVKVLTQKFTEMQEYLMNQHWVERSRRDIQSKKKKLGDLRKYHLETGGGYSLVFFPMYLDELLEQEYINLYNHLFKVRIEAVYTARSCTNPLNQRKITATMSFSEIALVVLETRDAIIQKVASCIPEGHRNILFLLGNSGAGCSTALCLLRGDQMVLIDGYYESLSDKNKLIRDLKDQSCTFLPNIEIINDCVIVDFPGFENTYGPIVTLGQEFALKHLVSKYHPKILVLHAITNVDDNFAFAARLGLRLRRLLGAEHNNCVLAITKSSRDIHSEKIREIEKNERERRLTPTDREKELELTVKILSNLKNTELEKEIQKAKQELEDIKQKKMQELHQPSPLEAEREQFKRKMSKKINVLMRQIGLNKVLILDDFLLSVKEIILSGSTFKQEDKDPYTDISLPILDPEDERLLGKRFVEDMSKEGLDKKKRNTATDRFISLDKDKFTAFLKTHPEIAEFLNLPEMDPEFVKNLSD